MNLTFFMFFLEKYLLLFYINTIYHFKYLQIDFKKESCFYNEYVFIRIKFEKGRKSNFKI